MIFPLSIPIDNQGTPDPLGILPCGNVSNVMPYGGVGPGTFYPVGFTAQELVGLVFGIKSITMTVSQTIKENVPESTYGYYESGPEKGKPLCPGGFTNNSYGNGSMTYLACNGNPVPLSKPDDIICSEYIAWFPDSSFTVSYLHTTYSFCGNTTTKETALIYGNVIAESSYTYYTNGLYYPGLIINGLGFSSYKIDGYADYVDPTSIDNYTFNVNGGSNSVFFNTKYFSKQIPMYNTASFGASIDPGWVGSQATTVTLSAEYWDYGT